MRWWNLRVGGVGTGTRARARPRGRARALERQHLRASTGQEQQTNFINTNTNTITTKFTGHKRKTWWQLRQEYEGQQARKRLKTARAVRTGGAVRDRARAGATEWDTG